jgi:carbonic anhydrase/acetyltransferase-like protein (isoleucine patch superfamily)
MNCEVVMIIKELNHHTPQFGEDCFLAESLVIIGNNVSVGHNAIAHGCTIHDNVLVGMGAIVMDDCVVERNTIIAAGAQSSPRERRLNQERSMAGYQRKK